MDLEAISALIMWGSYAYPIYLAHKRHRSKLLWLFLTVLLGRSYMAAAILFAFLTGMTDEDAYLLMAIFAMSSAAPAILVLYYLGPLTIQGQIERQRRWERWFS